MQLRIAVSAWGPVDQPFSSDTAIRFSNSAGTEIGIFKLSSKRRILSAAVSLSNWFLLYEEFCSTKQTQDIISSATCSITIAPGITLNRSRFRLLSTYHWMANLTGSFHPGSKKRLKNPENRLEIEVGLSEGNQEST